MATTLDRPRIRANDALTWGLVTLGLMTVGAALVASIVAAVAGADAFPVTDAVNASRDNGVVAATSSWTAPLALVGLAVIFTGVYAALVRIRSSIGERRDALASSLPRLIKEQ